MGRKDKPISPEASDNLSLGQLMRQSRQSKGITLSDLARRLGYTRGYLSMIENGHKQPPHELVKSYEQVLGLESEYLSQALQSKQTGVSVQEQEPTYQNHLDRLRQGVDSWNQWREEHAEIRSFLARATLVDIELSGANLNAADLTRADLSGAKLSKADLSSAILRQALMSRAILNGANLSRSYLNGVKLFSANLSEANLSEANLSGADLSNANLSGADLSMADMSGSDLTRTNLTGANLSMTDLNKVTVTNTVFGNVDLSQVRGLESVQHTGPSIIGLDTILRSQGNIPEVFLKKAGVDVKFIAYIRSLTSHPTEYYSCFISYSSKDQDFAERLYADLQSNGIQCWFAPEDMKIGDKIRPRINDAIKLSDKIIVILSEQSVESAWVAMEIEAALAKEQRLKRPVLFPIRLDDAVMRTPRVWAADMRRIQHIGDFEHWKEPDVYQKAFRRLLRDLNTSYRSSVSQDMALLAEQAVFRWFERLHYQPKPNKARGMPDFIFIDKDGNKVAVEVKFDTEPRTLRHRLEDIFNSLKKIQAGFDRLLIVTAFPDEAAAQKASLFLSSIEKNPSSGISLTIGYIQHNEFQEI